LVERAVFCELFYACSNAVKMGSLLWIKGFSFFLSQNVQCRSKAIPQCSQDMIGIWSRSKPRIFLEVRWDSRKIIGMCEEMSKCGSFPKMRVRLISLPKTAYILNQFQLKQASH
jgi:hypothetical protein